MRSNNAPRLRRIRLVMLFSIAVLAGFLGYWLRNEYLNEKSRLQKELRQLVSDTRNAITDSLIVKNLIRPLELGISDHSGVDSGRELIDSMIVRNTDTGTFTYRMRRRVSKTLPPPQASMITDSAAQAPFGGKPVVLAFNDSDEIVNFSRGPFGPDSIVHVAVGSRQGSVSLNRNFSITSSRSLETGAGNDSFNQAMTRSVKLLVTALSKLPGGPDHPFTSPDSADLRNAYWQASKKAGLPVHLHWEDSLHASAANIDIDAAEPSGRLLMATGYQGYLLQQMSPQILFSAFLLCLTALAFGMTFRALRSQIQLAAIRNDFISNMSHELKTPVSTVKVALEAISEPEVLQNTALASDYLQMANLELGRLELLVNQALQSALLESGQLHTDRQTLDLAAISEQMIRIMRGRFQQQGGDISMSREGKIFQIGGDALHLQGVIVNILDNALKYAGASPVVDVKIRELTDSVSLRIIDHGPGIPAQYRTRVFDKFFRVPKGNEHSVKGYGLGLNYAAQIMRVHRGSIGVTETPGGGSTFELIIPKSGS